MDAVTEVKNAIGALKGVFDKDVASLRARMDELECGRKRLGSGGDPDADKGGFDTFAEFAQTLCFKRSDPRIEALGTKAAEVGLMSSPSAGGVLVPDAWNFALVQHIATQTVVRSRARLIPSDSQHPEQTVYLPLLDYREGRRAGVEVDWYSEGSAIHESDNAAWDAIPLTPKELGGIVTLSDKLLRNTAALEQVLTQILGDAIGAAQDRAFFAGSGPGQPIGIHGHVCSIEVERETPGHVTFKDVVAMLAAGIPAGRFVWVISQTVLPELLTMVLSGSTAAPIWQPSAQAGVPGTLLGYPLIVWEGAPTLGSYGDIGLYDFNYYALKDGIGIRLDASQSVGDNFSKGLTSIRIRASVDGAPMLSAPWLLDDGATETSPFVLLGNEGS